MSATFLYCTVGELCVIPNISIHAFLSFILICSIFIAYSLLIAILFGHQTFWKELLVTERSTKNVYRSQYYFSTPMLFWALDENKNYNEQTSTAPVKRVQSFTELCKCLSIHPHENKIIITEKLPEQIIRNICKYLNASDLLRISTASRLMFKISNQKPLWKWLNQNTFGKTPSWTDDYANEIDERSDYISLRSYDSETSTDSSRSVNSVTLRESGMVGIDIDDNHNCASNKNDKNISTTDSVRSTIATLKHNYFRKLNLYLQYLLSHISSSNTNMITDDKYNKFNINISNFNSHNNSGSHTPSTSIASQPFPHINVHATLIPTAAVNNDDDDENTDSEEEEDESDVDTAIICVHQRIFILPPSFLQNGTHPGGSDILRHYHRRDATVLFEVASHSKKAKLMMKPFLFWDIARYRDVAVL